jgi:hypothetical protein
MNAHPWEGLGVSVDPSDSPDKMARKTGLNWTVEKAPLSLDVEGKKVNLRGYALIQTFETRVDLDPLGLVYEDWEPVQNEEGIAFFKSEAAAAGLELEAVGTFAGERLVWVLARSNEPRQLPNDEVWEKGVVFTVPHTYGQTVSSRVVMIRRDVPSLYTFDPRRYGHRKRALLPDPHLKANLDTSADQFYRRAVRELGKKEEEEVARKFFKRVFPSKAKLSKAGRLAMETWKTDPKAGGTRWGLFTAVSHTVDNLVGNERETSLESAWFGINSKVKQKALVSL